MEELFTSQHRVTEGNMVPLLYLPSEFPVELSLHSQHS